MAVSRSDRHAATISSSESFRHSQRNPMLNTLCLVALLAASTIFVLLFLRACRVKSRSARWSGLSLTGLMVLACLIPPALMVTGIAKSRSRRAPVPEIKIAATSEQIQRGQAIASGFCGACHSSSGTMTGGRDLGEHLPAPLGHFIAANLTPGGPLSHWSDGQIFRAIRNSIDANGRWLTEPAIRAAVHRPTTRPTPVPASDRRGDRSSACGFA